MVHGCNAVSRNRLSVWKQIRPLLPLVTKEHKRSLRCRYALYFSNVSLGTMFMDCSSWKSSLQAYGILSDDTVVLDLQ